VLEPQSTTLFVLLMAVFGLLAWWMVRARQPVLRLLAGCLAFVPAVLFGVVAVNKYYGYYQTWHAVVADFSNQGGTGLPTGTVNATGHVSQLTKSDLQLARQQGYLEVFTLPGKLSHITRTVYVYLPPQYFQPAYQHYRFPALELIHGQPGAPQDWVNVMDVTNILDQQVTTGQAKPVVLVIPDANGGENISLQCLNMKGGPQDMTYLGKDVPTAIAHKLRVMPPGPAWGIAGYSEGGYCAANMALRDRTHYGFAGVMSGYFAPLKNTLQNPYRVVNPFGGNRALQAANTPLSELRKLPPGTKIPSFWLGAGTQNRQDVALAETFWQELLLRQANVPLILTRGEGHNMGTWRKEVPAMLTWMTPRLALAAQLQIAGQQAKARASASARPGATPSAPGLATPAATRPVTRPPHAVPSATRTTKIRRAATPTPAKP
jgi:enterochelin esterase-like enzyme